MTTAEAEFRRVLEPLAALPVGPELFEEVDYRSIVLYHNAGRAITVGDVLDAREVLSRQRAPSETPDQRQEKIVAWFRSMVLPTNGPDWSLLNNTGQREVRRHNSRILAFANAIERGEYDKDTSNA